MKLRQSLAFPLFAVAIAVTVAGVAGSILLVGRTTAAATAQQSRQFRGIAEHVLSARGRELAEVVTILGTLEGRLRSRMAAWTHIRVDAAAIMDPATGLVRDAVGDPLSAADLRALAGATTLPEGALLIGGPHGLYVGATDRGIHRGPVVLAARRLDGEFAAALKSLLGCDVRVVSLAGVVDTSPANIPADRTSVTLPLHTPGGTTATLTMLVPSGEVGFARRRAIGAAALGGLALLGVSLALYARTVRTTQARLVHSAQLASLGQMVAGVSHELNNPLSILLSHAEYQATRIRPGDAGREELDIILDEGRRMKRILADLRTLARPAAPVRILLDLNAVVLEVATLIRHDAGRAGVACNTDLAPGTLMVRASPDEMRQVVLNLALNALQAMPDGGRLAVATRPGGGDSRPAARVTIRDTGRGIPPDLLSRVTEPFFSTTPGRMGLGLAICQDILLRHGGSLIIASHAGEGTTVTVALPSEPA